MTEKLKLSKKVKELQKRRNIRLDLTKTELKLIEILKRKSKDSVMNEFSAINKLENATKSDEYTALESLTKVRFSDNNF